MFSRRTAIVWTGIVLLSSMFLMGQENWQPRELYVFVTGELYVGDLGGLTGADAICQAEADEAGLDGRYKAWVSDATAGPNTRFIKNNVPYLLVDRTRVALDWDDLMDGMIEHPIDLRANGQQYTGSTVWSNTRWDGSPSNRLGNPLLDSCEDWQMVEVTGNVGNVGDLRRWSDAGKAVDCHLATGIYCFQQKWEHEP